MTAIGGQKPGNVIVSKTFGDAPAPYRVFMMLPDGRLYHGYLRSLPVGNTTKYRYEGFVTAQDVLVAARDERLKRHPVAPVPVPEEWDLWPCQMKLSPCPDGLDVDRPCHLIGEVWVSSGETGEGSDLFVVKARYRGDKSVAFEGSVEPYCSSLKDRI